MNSPIKKRLTRVFVAAAAVAGIIQDLFIGLSDGVPYVWMVFAFAAVMALAVRMIPSVSQRMKSIFSEAWFSPLFIFLLVAMIGTMTTGYYSRVSWSDTGGDNDNKGSGFIVSHSEDILYNLGVLDKKLTDTQKTVEETNKNVKSLEKTQLDMLRYHSLIGNISNEDNYEEILGAYWERGRVTPNHNSLIYGKFYGAPNFTLNLENVPYWVYAIEDRSVSAQEMKKYFDFYHDKGYLNVKDFKSNAYRANDFYSSRRYDNGCEINYAGSVLPTHCLKTGYIRWYKDVDMVGGLTPLIYAIVVGGREKLDVVVDMGVDVHESDASGYRPIDYALLSGNAYAIEKLIKLGVDSGQQSSVICAFSLLADIVSNGTNVALMAEADFCKKYTPKLEEKYFSVFEKAATIYQRQLESEIDASVKEYEDRYGAFESKAWRDSYASTQGIEQKRKIKDVDELLRWLR
ncbi:hypothetical protein Y017_13150 [Alcanivorax sp. 97CO-5]|jgi:hypothetical protein|uniref:hypothetical protein n=1 Tax=unclassified Alcanivorax TaxID=2638842 RepID=UPI0003E809EE|nr:MULTISPECIES: hypothetical protein [unclassified Alcanivorax]EUC69907.1 hypothetical protein Y017_13150 [Alcanivorax sp. 97CO-5]PKG01692.1 hypothetical protein Y019_08020 [Alcanivorax sp. 97CO-6]|tara:strand:+ start:3564 stop:4940 length:1377 start_codon:yes stop_codon:yes gene_type:complete